MAKLLLTDDRLKAITKKALEKRGLTLTGYSVDGMKEIAESLRKELCDAISHVIPSFDVNAVKVLKPVKDYEDSYTVNIHFPDEILKRKSLWTGYSSQFPNENGRYMGYSGDSVYDVIGLWTKGWRASNYVYGYWVGHENKGYIRSKVYRPPNSFISDVVNAFIAEHPDVKINYPHEWGG